MIKVNLYPEEIIKVNGIRVEYSRIPAGLVKGFEGIVYSFKTTDAYDTKAHEDAVRPLLKQIEADGHDHGLYWELRKCEAIIWEQRSQVTVASFRMRDIY